MFALGLRGDMGPQLLTWRIQDGLYVIEGMEEILPPVGPPFRRLPATSRLTRWPSCSWTSISRTSSAVVMKQQTMFEEMWGEGEEREEA